MKRNENTIESENENDISNKRRAKRPRTGTEHNYYTRLKSKNNQQP